jgi:hypothetical protein
MLYLLIPYLALLVGFVCGCFWTGGRNSSRIRRAELSLPTQLEIEKAIDPSEPVG